MKVMIIFELEDNELVRDQFNNAIHKYVGFDKVKVVKELLDDSHLKKDKKYNKIYSEYKESRNKKDEYILNHRQ